jgi:hypothetical protein
LEALKPLLSEHGATLTISDEIAIIGDRYYVKALASFSLAGETPVTVSAYAREPLSKKGMDEAQITGATSSYARKYALNGLFAIDDTKDADATETHGKSETKPRINKQQMQKSTAAILDCLEAEDELGMKQVIDELNEDEQQFIWPSFDTKQKSAIKKMLHSANNKEDS